MRKMCSGSSALNMASDKTQVRSTCAASDQIFRSEVTSDQTELNSDQN